MAVCHILIAQNSCLTLIQYGFVITVLNEQCSLKDRAAVIGATEQGCCFCPSKEIHKVITKSKHDKKIPYYNVSTSLSAQGLVHTKHCC